MESKRFVAIASIVGAALPVLLILIRQVVTGANGGSVALMWVTLGLWPSSIMLMGTAGAESVDVKLIVLHLASIAVNVFLYATVGAGLWYGLNRHQGVLFAMALLIVAFWAGLSRL